MMKRLKAARLTWIILFTLLITAQATVLSQPTATNVPQPTAAPAYTIEQVNAALKEVVPLVEEVTGREFVRVPPFKLISRQQLRDIINGGQTHRDSRPRDGVRGARDCQPDISAYAFGLYQPQNNTVYMVPGNFRPRMDIAGVSSRYDQDIVKMIVAHELAHAMHLQVIGTRKQPVRRQRMSPSSYRAIRATTEGFGMFVMDEVAMKLGLTQAMKEFPKTISAGLAVDPNSDCAKRQNIRQINEGFRQEMRSVYLDGEKFIRWHYTHGGNTAVFRILANPPTDWSVILHPERYAPTKQKEPANVISARLPTNYALEASNSGVFRA